MAIAGIELALWDVKAKALGVPVYELLGGNDHRRDPTFHVSGTATKEKSVTNIGDKWIRVPLIRLSRRNDVGMAGETQKR